jgi:hypothetical protein
LLATEGGSEFDPRKRLSRLVHHFSSDPHSSAANNPSRLPQVLLSDLCGLLCGLCAKAVSPLWSIPQGPYRGVTVKCELYVGMKSIT